MNRTILNTIAALALAAPVAAQGVMAVQPVPLPAQASMEKQVVERARMAVESRITPGAPYSADAITESVQALSDGNRIARKNATRIYRDSEGRTRREQLSTTGELLSISISDPVAGSNYLLTPADKTAHRNGVIMATGSGFAAASVTPGGNSTVTVVPTAEGGVRVSAAGDAPRKREAETQAAATAGVAAGGFASASGAGRGGGEPAAYTAGVLYPAEGVSLPRTVAPGGFAGGGNVSKEDLGTQAVEGVLATGTRTTTTIAAGTIGNEQPIVIVSEQWFSPDLKVLVLTKHSDPRSGETVYRLTNIVQTEPARSLFEVPADYTLKDSVIRRQSPMQP
jgi:hypothetical protein